MIRALLCLLIAAPVFASNFPVADMIYLPIVTTGTYKSDVTITNESDDPVVIEALFVANNRAPVQQRVYDKLRLAPRETREHFDILATLNILSPAAGLVVLYGCREGGACRDRISDNGDFRNISATSYLSHGGLAQSVDGIPWWAYGDAAHPLRIVGIRSSSQWRTNLGLVNASEYSSCDLTVRLIDGTTGQQRDAAAVHLEPLESRQVNITNLFPRLGEWSRLNRTRAAENVVVRVEQSGVVPVANPPADCADGCPAFLAYGSLIDLTTMDGTTLNATFTTPLSDAQVNALFGGK